MKNLKKDLYSFYEKNNLRFKEGTIERQRQDFLAWREKKQLSQKKPDKKPVQLDLF